VAVISVKKGKKLWSASYESVKDSASVGYELALNGNTLAYVSGKGSSMGKKLCVRDIWTGKLREGELVRQKGPSQSPDLCSVASIQAHPRRDLVYVITRQAILLFSMTTANCIGRLSILKLRNRSGSVFTPSYPSTPLMLHFSESEQGCGPSVREKFFACYCAQPFSFARVFQEFEVPTNEEVVAVEAKLLNEEIPGKLLVFKPVRVQIYQSRYTEINPFLKISADIWQGRRDGSATECRILSFKELLHASFTVLDEKGKREVKIPLAEYTSRPATPTCKPKQGVPRGIKWGENRSKCLFWGCLGSRARVQQRYIIFSHHEDAYLLAFEPRW
jgi:hypothetical protein